jgi:hypothetical protein
MEHSESIMTAAEERPISPAEAAIVRWMVLNAPVRGSTVHLEPGVAALRVVGRCSCGCPSVDFASHGQAPPARPIADAIGRTQDGVEVGVILWGRENVITGLEIYEFATRVSGLPVLQSMRAW